MLKKFGFEQLTKLSSIDTTLANNNYTYDRIFIKRGKYFEIIKDAMGIENGGVVEFRTLFEKNLKTRNIIRLQRESNKIF